MDDRALPVTSIATTTAPQAQSAAWMASRRPLLFALVLGCGVSLLASGRFTLRLVVDGTLSFAFVPLCELVAFAIVYRLQRGTRPFAQAVDRYFAGNTPWLWWLVASMAAARCCPLVELGSLLAPLLFTSPIPIALSVRFDWRLFRERRAHTTAGDGGRRPAARVAWSLATAYFLGVAITRRDFFYLFVECGTRSPTG